MPLPCEDIYWNFGPAVTGAICRDLSEAGWPGKKIAEALGITSASVSYFLKYKRGTTPLPPKALSECMKLCKKIREGKTDSAHIQIQTAKIAVMAKYSGRWKMQNEMLAVCKSCLVPRMKIKSDAKKVPQ